MAVLIVMCFFVSRGSIRSVVSVVKSGSNRFVRLRDQKVSGTRCRWSGLQLCLACGFDGLVIHSSLKLKLSERFC